MPRGNRIQWEPIKIAFLAGRTARELGILFNVNPAVILNKSSTERWGELRKQVRSAPLVDSMPRPSRNLKTPSEAPKEVLSVLESADLNASLKSNLTQKEQKSPDAISRALKIRNSDGFRDRVITQASKALDALEKATVTTVHETDRFAEALTKVERIGARAFGYDHEGNLPIINIGILGTGSEYDPV